MNLAPGRYYLLTLPTGTRNAAQGGCGERHSGAKTPAIELPNSRASITGLSPLAPILPKLLLMVPFIDRSACLRGTVGCI